MIEVDMIDLTTLDSPTCLFVERRTGLVWMRTNWPTGEDWHQQWTPLCPYSGAELWADREEGEPIQKAVWRCPHHRNERWWETE